MIKLFEMFAGYGGASFALKKAGIEHEVVGFSEIDKYAIQCYEQNHKGKNYGDCTKIDPNELPDFDLLTGGFPCQSFSIAGKREGFKSEKTGNLFFEIMRIAEVKKPKYMLLENVKGILSHDGGNTHKRVIKEVESLGYGVLYKCLNSKNHGIPQNRERVWYVCKLGGWSFMEFQFPEPEELKLFLKDILEDNPNYKYNLTESNIKTINRNFGAKGKVIDMTQNLSVIEKMTYPSRINQTKADISPTLTQAMGTGGGNVPCIAQKYYLSDEQIKRVINNSFNQAKTRIQKDGIAQTLLARDYKDPKLVAEIVEISKNKYLNNRIYANNGISPCLNVKESKDVKILDLYNNKIKENICPTLTDPNHNNLRLLENKDFKIRKLTPKECFRLMGFLDDKINLDNLSDTQKYKLAGNGWDINIVSKIFKEMFKNELV